MTQEQEKRLTELTDLLDAFDNEKSAKSIALISDYEKKILSLLGVTENVEHCYFRCYRNPSLFIFFDNDTQIRYYYQDDYKADKVYYIIELVNAYYIKNEQDLQWYSRLLEIAKTIQDKKDALDQLIIEWDKGIDAFNIEYSEKRKAIWQEYWSLKDLKEKEEKDAKLQALKSFFTKDRKFKVIKPLGHGMWVGQIVRCVSIGIKQVTLNDYNYHDNHRLNVNDFVWENFLEPID